MTALPYTVLERLTIVAPFGLGFWDAAAARLVSDGLRVRVFRTDGPYARDVTEAVAGRNGVFVPHTLFGARRFIERSAADPGSPPERLLVEVRDTLDRYLSFVMHVTGARDDHFAVPECAGEAAWTSVDLASPAVAGPYVPLFPLPSRPVPAGTTAVRASLTDKGTRLPAEGAVLDVREGGRLIGRGVADQRGEVAAFFGYPEVPAPAAWSPPRSPPPPVRLEGQRWTLDVAVLYRRNLPRHSPGGSRPALFDLCDVLRQPVATLSHTSPPGITGEVDLRYGEEAILGDLLIDPV
jgi:hypothetical protein